MTDSENGISDENRIFCYKEGTDEVVVRATSATMTRCEVYHVSGRLVDSVSYPATEYQLRLSPGINLIKVYIEGKVPRVLKLSNY